MESHTAGLRPLAIAVGAIVLFGLTAPGASVHTDVGEVSVDPALDPGPPGTPDEPDSPSGPDDVDDPLPDGWKGLESPGQGLTG